MFDRTSLGIIFALVNACASVSDPDTAANDAASQTDLRGSGDGLETPDSSGQPDTASAPDACEGCEEDVAADSGCLNCEDIPPCTGDDCPEIVCDPKTFVATCQGETELRTCRADGTAIDVLSCGDSAVCSEGACVTVMCVPGDSVCASDSETKQCNAIGSAFLQPSPCPAPARCDADRCLTPCEAAALDRGALGCRFVLPSGELRITGEAGASLTLDGVDAGLLDPAGLTLLAAPDSSGAHILVASAPVTVQLAVDAGPGDLAQALPPPAWGYDHVVSGWPAAALGGTSRVRLVSAGSGTHVTVAATTPLMVVSGGDTVIATIARGTAKTLTIPLTSQLDLTTTVPGDDLTGTRVTASAPIGVFYSHDCASVPAGVSPCGPLLEQVPPVDRLGGELLALPWPPRAAAQPDTFRLVAIDDNVLVEFTPPLSPPAVLERGASMTWSSSQRVRVSASGRVLLTHLSAGATFLGHGTECGGKGIGGPSLAWVPPLSDLARQARIAVAEGEGVTVLSLYVPESDAEVLVDGVAPTWQVTAPFRHALVALTPGTHAVEATKGVWSGSVLTERCGGSASTVLVSSLAGKPAAAVAKSENDSDGDGVADGDDCAPSNSAINPSASEGCNAIDDDCDGATDEEGALGCITWFSDGDGDGSGSQSLSGCVCAAPTAVAVPFSGDCDDQNPYLGPLVLEICNGVDDDCDDVVDEGCDADSDGWCADDAIVTMTEGICALGLGDCVDTAAAVNPGAPEIFTNSLDDDCDGLIDTLSTTLPISDCSGLNCVGPTHSAIVCALDICYGPDVVTDLALLAPNGGSPKNLIAASGQLGVASNGLAPRTGTSTLVLSTGKVGDSNTDVAAGTTSTVDPLPDFPFKVWDVAEVVLTMVVPDAATGFSFDTLFMSTELPEDAGKPEADRLYVLLDASVTTAGEPEPIGLAACTPDLVVAETTDGSAPACFIGVNSVFVEPCSGSAATSLAGTPYACSADGGSTGWLRLTHPAVGGETMTLTFRLVDVGDALNDSQALIDNITWLTGPVTADVSPL